MGSTYFPKATSMSNHFQVNYDWGIGISLELLFKGEVIYGDTGTNPRACQIGVRAFVRTTTLRKYVFQFSGRVHTQTSLYLIRGTDLRAVLFPIFASLNIFSFTLRFIVSVLLPHFVQSNHRLLETFPDFSKVFVSYNVTLTLKFHSKLIAVISM